jgi:hypothetical protein
VLETLNILVKSSLLLSIAIAISIIGIVTILESFYPFRSIEAQVLLPEEMQQQSNDNITGTRSESTTTTTATHSSYDIEGNSDLLKAKIPMIKKAVISQIYGVMGIAQKGSNQTFPKVNAIIVNEIDNSTSKTTSLDTTRSLTGIQITNAIEKLISSSDNTQSSQLRKIIVENKSECSHGLNSNVNSTASDCNLTIRIHQ